MSKPVAYLWVYLPTDARELRIAAHADVPARSEEAAQLAEAVTRKVVDAELLRWMMLPHAERGLVVRPAPSMPMGEWTRTHRLQELARAIRAAVREALQSAGYTVRKA